MFNYIEKLNSIEQFKTLKEDLKNADE